MDNDTTEHSQQHSPRQQINTQQSGIAFNNKKQSPFMVHKIIQSTEEIINSQAINIYELNQQIIQLKKTNEISLRKLQIIMNSSLTDHKKQDIKNTNKLLQQIVQLQDQVIKLKVQLAQLKEESLIKHFDGLKIKQKSSGNFSNQQSLTMQDINHKKSIVPIMNLSKMKQSIMKSQEINRKILEDEVNGQLALQWRKNTELYLFPDAHSSKIIKFKEKTWQLAKKGIPEYLREKLWPIIYENSLGISTTLYTQLLSAIKKCPPSKKVSDQINKDIARSFYSRTQFDSKIGLKQQIKEILEVFHMHRPDISYVQGMTYPIIVLDLIVGKYRAFTIFTNLIIKNSFFRRLFGFEDNYVSIYCRMFEYYLKEAMPQLNQHLLKLKIQAEVYLIEWFYTFFSRSLSYEATLRIWDLLAYQAELILYKLGLTIFKQLQTKLLSSQYQQTITMILQFPLHTGCSEIQLLQKSLAYKLSADKFQKVFDKIYKEI